MATGTPVLSPRASTVELHPLEPNRIYAILDESPYRSDDYAESWNRLLDPTIDSHALDSLTLSPANPATLYAEGWPDGVFWSNDYGETWNDAELPANLSGPSRVFAHPDDPNQAYVACLNDSEPGRPIEVWRYEYTGSNTWEYIGETPANVGGTNSLAVDTTTVPNRFYVTSTSAGFFWSLDGGATFTNSDNSWFGSMDVREVALHPLNPDVTYNCGRDNVFERFHWVNPDMLWEVRWGVGDIDCRALESYHLPTALDPARTVVFLGLERGFVNWTEDEGLTWGTMSDWFGVAEASRWFGGPIDDIAFDPGSTIIYLAVYGAGVYRFVPSE
jgi:hypothetical protein